MDQIAILMSKKLPRRLGSRVEGPGRLLWLTYQPSQSGFTRAFSPTPRLRTMMLNWMKGSWPASLPCPPWIFVSSCSTSSAAYATATAYKSFPPTVYPSASCPTCLNCFTDSIQTATAPLMPIFQQAGPWITLLTWNAS